MKKSLLFLLLVIAATALVAVSCAPAPTPTPAPTAVPTKAPSTAVPATTAPTAVPPTAAPATVAPTVAATTAPATAAPSVAATSAPTAAATAASSSPTKAASAPAGALAPIKATPVLPTGTPKSADDMLEITPQQLRAMIEGGADIVIVDNQPAEAFALGHIPGAVNVPWDMKIKAPSGLSQSKLLVLYCGCSPEAKPSETDAGDVAMQLYTNFGYRKIATLEGGWDTWQQMGYPVAKGK